MITKFRHFKNYVFLNAILGTIFSFISFLLDFSASQPKPGSLQYMVLLYLLDFLRTYFKLVAHCWLLVLCCIFYLDIVQVFNTHVSRRYLKSALFAWGVPLILFIIYSLSLPLLGWLLSKHFENETMKVISKILFFLDIFVIFVPLVINVLIYIRVLIELFNTTNVPKSAINSRRFYIATLIFLLSGVIFLISPLWLFVEPPDVIITVIDYLPSISMDVYFLIVKSNRDLWLEFYVKRIKKTSCNALAN